ncbi:MAG: RNA polymerase sigma factor RpoD/SigA [Bacteroidaceae bacterium]|jgi:RNA polymerase primary sigma factor|nr:RNA polymerase sigma factor RpoD/SigA [Bacteroidaceae bacterium]
MRQLKITQSITNRASAALDKYLVEIGREDLITTDEEVELAQRIHKGDERALERLVCANLRFVVSVAKQYQNQGLSLNDLINEGNMGLIKAARKFDETRGFKFISYAVWWIRQSILQAISEQSRIVRMPLNQVGFQSKLSKAKTNFEQKYERQASIEELSELMKEPELKIADALGSNGKKVSVDAPLQNDDSSAMIDTMQDENQDPTDIKMERESLDADLGTALGFLAEREQKVLIMIFGLFGCPEMTAEEVANKLNLTRERVRQIKERALRRLRDNQEINVLKKYF